MALGRAAGLLLLAAMTVSQSAKAEPYKTDSQGRTFRVEFDPGSQVRLGILTGVSGPDSYSHTTAIESGVAYRSVLLFEETKEPIRWQLDNRFLWGQVRPWENGPAGMPALDASLYSGTYLRHTKDSYLVFPSSPPRRLYFPFDLGVQTEVGKIRVLPRQGPVDIMHLGVARSSILLDPWRSERVGNSLEIGVGVRYDLDLLGQPQIGPSVKTLHRLAPFTASSLRWRYQDAPGRTAIELMADWFPHWRSEGGWETRAYSAQGRWQRVVLAVNDQPVSVVLEADYCRYPAAGQVPSREELKALAGLTLHAQLR